MVPRKVQYDTFLFTEQPPTPTDPRNRSRINTHPHPHYSKIVIIPIIRNSKIVFSE
jgi:hypothetical protein